MNSDIREMEIADYNILRNFVSALYRMWKMKWIIVFSTIIGLLLSIAFFKYRGTTPKYYYSAAIYSAVYGSSSDTFSGITIMNTYASVLGTSRVCASAASEIDDPEITAEYLMNLVNSNNIMLVGASNESKNYGYRLELQTILESTKNVMEITNAMANAYVAEINDLLGTDTLQVFEKATYVGTVKERSNLLYYILFAAGGFLLSAGIIFLKEFFSSKVYLVSQCESDKKQILGLLPYTK